MLLENFRAGSHEKVGNVLWKSFAKISFWLFPGCYDATSVLVLAILSMDFSLPVLPRSWLREPGEPAMVLPPKWLNTLDENDEALTFPNEPLLLTWNMPAYKREHDNPKNCATAGHAWDTLRHETVSAHTTLSALVFGWPHMIEPVPWVSFLSNLRCFQGAGFVGFDILNFAHVGVQWNLRAKWKVRELVKMALPLIPLGFTCLSL